jgi:outer membrane protein
VLGLSTAYVPEYEGSNRRVLKFRPLWAWQHGRYRISTSGAGAVLAFGIATPDTGAGASADFIRTDKLRFGAALRIDNGRSSSDSVDLAGVPDIRRTVRARAFVSYALDAHWGAAASLSQDILGRQGGALGSIDLGYHARLGEKTEWSAGLGMRFGDHRYMMTRYGVPPEAALPDRPAFDAGAGIETITAGVGITSALTPRWILFGTLGGESLRGSAAASPLTRSSTGSAVTIGIAYRCCTY